MMVDPIADMLARLRNAHQALHQKVAVPRSKMKLAVCEILKNEGYILDYSAGERDITVELKYDGGTPLISGMKRVSKPGRRVYVGAQDIPSVQNGLGICVLSTSRGVLAGGEAKAQNIGGELLFEVW
ncbi:MAG: 30S ribosomal protein S8 [Thermodesulfobacteriota bacterium]